MKTYRDIMGDSDLDWCRCYAARDNSAFFVRCEGRIISAQLDGEDISTKDEAQLLLLARRINPCADDYEDVMDAINDSYTDRCGCSRCPWNDICEAMDEPAGDEDEDEDEDGE